MMGVEENQQRIADNSAAFFILFFHRITGQSQSEATHVSFVPIFFGHFLTIRTKPRQVFDFRPPNATTLKKSPSTQHRLRPTKSNEFLDKRIEIAGRAIEFPIVPTQFIVLAIRIIISTL